MVLHQDCHSDECLYNLPISNEVVMVFQNDNGVLTFECDIRVCS